MTEQSARKDGCWYCGSKAGESCQKPFADVPCRRTGTCANGPPAATEELSPAVGLSEFEQRCADGYRQFRGRCKELSEAACKADPTLTLVRGHYFCPIWNTDEPHWWTARPDGSIHDPSVAQFPSRSLGIYTPFDGRLSCSECGKEMSEEDADIDGNYAFCSARCRCVANHRLGAAAEGTAMNKTLADELLECIEEWAERLSATRAATEIPMPAELHVQGQADSIELTLREMVAVLKDNDREVPIDCEGPQ